MESTALSRLNTRQMVDWLLTNGYEYFTTYRLGMLVEFGHVPFYGNEDDPRFNPAEVEAVLSL